MTVGRLNLVESLELVERQSYLAGESGGPCSLLLVRLCHL